MKLNTEFHDNVTNAQRGLQYCHTTPRTAVEHMESPIILPVDRLLAVHAANTTKRILGSFGIHSS